MARNHEDHDLIKPKMFYGSDIQGEAVNWESQLEEKDGEGIFNVDTSAPLNLSISDSDLRESNPDKFQQERSRQHSLSKTETYQQSQAEVKPPDIDVMGTPNEFPRQSVSSDLKTSDELAKSKSSIQISSWLYSESSRLPRTSNASIQRAETSTTPSKSRARLVRSFSRKLHRSIKTMTPEENKFRLESATMMSQSFSGQPDNCLLKDNYTKYKNNSTRRSIGHISTGFRVPSVPALKSRNQLNRSPKSKLSLRRVSILGGLSRGTFYNHSDIVDDNLLISATKLDSTLIRLFSHTRDLDNKNRQDVTTILMPFLNYSQSDLISMDPVMWRVFPMDAAQKETLDQELPYIEENIVSTDIAKDLYQKEILTHMDYNQLIRTEGQGDKAVTRLMIRTVQRRGDKAYPALLEVLQAHNYNEICQRLWETERSLRNGALAGSYSNKKNTEIEHIETHRHRSGHITPLRASRLNEDHDRFVVSANTQPYNTGEDVQPFHHEPLWSDTGTKSINELLTNQVPSLDNHVTSDHQIIDSEKLEKQLMELMGELEALQKEVNAMKSEASTTDSEVSHTEIETIESDQDGKSTLPDNLVHFASSDSQQRGTQKSSLCLIL